MNDKLLDLTTQIVIAAIQARPDLPITDTIREIYAALARAMDDPVPGKTEQMPAVPIKQSVKPDYLICLEDGKKLKMLKRYLRTQYGMTPAEYRSKWGLPPDYPMISPSYADRRSSIAKTIGLGTKLRK